MDTEKVHLGSASVFFHRIEWRSKIGNFGKWNEDLVVFSCLRIHLFSSYILEFYASKDMSRYLTWVFIVFRSNQHVEDWSDLDRFGSARGTSGNLLARYKSRTLKWQSFGNSTTCVSVVLKGVELWDEQIWKFSPGRD